MAHGAITSGPRGSPQIRKSGDGGAAAINVAILPPPNLKTPSPACPVGARLHPFTSCRATAHSTPCPVGPGHTSFPTSFQVQVKPPSLPPPPQGQAQLGLPSPSPAHGCQAPTGWLDQTLPFQPAGEKG